MAKKLNINHSSFPKVVTILRSSDFLQFSFYEGNNKIIEVCFDSLTNELLQNQEPIYFKGSVDFSYAEELYLGRDLILDSSASKGFKIENARLRWEYQSIVGMLVPRRDALEFVWCPDKHSTPFSIAKDIHIDTLDLIMFKKPDFKSSALLKFRFELMTRVGTTGERAIQIRYL